jgi:hypothetical protein
MVPGQLYSLGGGLQALNLFDAIFITGQMWAQLIPGPAMNLVAKTEGAAISRNWVVMADALRAS